MGDCELEFSRLIGYQRDTFMRLEQNWVPVPGHPVYRDPGLESNSTISAAA